MAIECGETSGTILLAVRSLHRSTLQAERCPAGCQAFHRATLHKNPQFAAPSQPCHCRIVRRPAISPFSSFFQRPPFPLCVAPKRCFAAVCRSTAARWCAWWCSWRVSMNQIARLGVGTGPWLGSWPNRRVGERANCTLRRTPHLRGDRATTPSARCLVRSQALRIGNKPKSTPTPATLAGEPAAA